MSKDYSYLKGNQHAKGNKPNKTAFKQGQEPWNKNVKGIHLSPGSEFKKGCISLKHKPVGTCTIRTDKTGKKRRWIKISEPNIWIEYAKYVWEKHHGAIPKGLLIHHKDTDTLNDNRHNLKCVTRSWHINHHRDLLTAGKLKAAETGIPIKEARNGQMALFA